VLLDALFFPSTFEHFFSVSLYVMGGGSGLWGYYEIPGSGDGQRRAGALNFLVNEGKPRLFPGAQAPGW